MSRGYRLGQGHREAPQVIGARHCSVLIGVFGCSRLSIPSGELSPPGSDDNYRCLSAEMLGQVTEVCELHPAPWLSRQVGSGVFLQKLQQLRLNVKRTQSGI